MHRLEAGKEFAEGNLTWHLSRAKYPVGRPVAAESRRARPDLRSVMKCYFDSISLSVLPVLFFHTKRPLAVPP